MALLFHGLGGAWNTPILRGAIMAALPGFLIGFLCLAVWELVSSRVIARKYRGSAEASGVTVGLVMFFACCLNFYYSLKVAPCLGFDTAVRRECRINALTGALDSPNGRPQFTEMCDRLLRTPDPKLGIFDIAISFVGVVPFVEREWPACAPRIVEAHPTN